MKREIEFDYIVRQGEELFHLPYTLAQIEDSSKLEDLRTYGRIISRRMYTGRIASGKYLYDGDIFRIHDSENPDYFDKYAFLCYWDGRGWNARLIQGPDSGYDSDYTYQWLPPLKEDCYDPDDSNSHIIVGNIDENPELLEPSNVS